MRWVAWAILFALGPQEKKAPLPDPTAQKAAEDLLRVVFKEDLARKGASDRLALAEKLFRQGTETLDDPASRFVLLRESKDLALEAGNFDLATRAMLEVARSFEGDFVPWKSAILAGATKVAKAPDECLRLSGSWLALAEESRAAGQFAAAEKAVAEAVSLAKKGKDISQVAKVEAKGREIAEAKGRIEELRKARETLAAQPDNPAANALLGVHECFELGQWDVGLPLLAKGSDLPLKTQASKDLAAPTEASSQALVGDGWWDLAEKDSGTRKEKLRSRARVWYARAVGSLTGPRKLEVAQRLGDLAAAQFGGEWIDLTDPGLFGLPGKAGDPLVLVPPDEVRSKRAELAKPPDRELDGVSARLQYTPEAKQTMGFFTLEGYTLAAYFDSLNNTFTVVRADMEKRIWVKERVQIVKSRLTFTMTILLDGPDYVFYLDGKELARWKAGSGKILPFGLQAQGGKVTYDQLKVRVKP